MEDDPATVLAPTSAPAFPPALRELALPGAVRLRGARPLPARLCALEVGRAAARAVVAHERGEASAWDLARGELLGPLLGLAGRPAALALSPGANRVAAADGQGLAVWDLEGLGPRGRDALRAPLEVRGLALGFVPDGRQVVVVQADGVVRGVDAQTGASTWAASRCPALVGATAAVVSPDGRLVAAGQPHGAVVVVYASTGTVIHSLPAEGAVRALAFTADGQRLLSGGDGGTWWWDVAAGKPIHRLREHERLEALAVSPRGDRALTLGADRTLVCWDLGPGRPLGRLPLAPAVAATAGVAFEPDGHQALVAVTLARPLVDGAGRGSALLRFSLL